MPQKWLEVTANGRTRKILIPHSHDIDGGQLNEIIAWQKEKTVKELEAMPPKKARSHTTKETGQALNEYAQFLRRKQAGEIKRYY